MKKFTFRCGWREITVLANTLSEAEYDLKKFIGSAILEHVSRDAIGGNIRFLPAEGALERADRTT